MDSHCPTVLSHQTPSPPPQSTTTTFEYAVDLTQLSRKSWYHHCHGPTKGKRQIYPAQIQPRSTQCKRLHSRDSELLLLSVPSRLSATRDNIERRSSTLRSGLESFRSEYPSRRSHLPCSSVRFGASLQPVGPTSPDPPVIGSAKGRRSALTYLARACTNLPARLLLSFVQILGYNCRTQSVIIGGACCLSFWLITPPGYNLPHLTYHQTSRLC